MSVKRYVVTRDLPGVDSFSNEQLKEAAQVSNKALDELKGEVQWVNSFVVADKTYCIYQAKVIARFLDLSLLLDGHQMYCDCNILHYLGCTRRPRHDVQLFESPSSVFQILTVFLRKTLQRPQNEEAIKKHAELSGFPATHIEEIKTQISPTTGS